MQPALSQELIVHSTDRLLAKPRHSIKTISMERALRNQEDMSAVLERSEALETPGSSGRLPRAVSPLFPTESALLHVAETVRMLNGVRMKSGATHRDASRSTVTHVGTLQQSRFRPADPDYLVEELPLLVFKVL
ncbi:MAG: uncharacterized protein KVP18_002652 [Porospora cf. gigantea A]|uniref:uncharacterized protein n=1 Tax=Porospora cf. gigantea A TaxID=2853593 RepID=UPI00355A6D3A|nr:MAG: hypothetical protein KVP18_002652 [Porospora cf. gigantea A]